jgi:hypothetical protein
MPFGIQHTILYPQDKKHNYSFPSADGMLASETFVADEIDRTLTKAKIEDLLEYNTRFVQLPALFRSTDNTLKDVTDFNFAVTNGKKYEIMLIAAYQSSVTTMGCKMGVRLSSGTGTIMGSMSGGINQTSVTTEAKAPIYAINATATTAGASFITTAVGLSATNHYLEALMLFTCTADGVFTFTFGNETTGTANVDLLANSYIKIIEF